MKKTSIALTLLTQSPLWAATPQDTLVIGFDAKPRAADPRLIGTDANSQFIEELRFLPLVSFGPNGEQKMMLAESVKAEKGNIWRVKIKQGVLFNNGREITSDDVVATYQSLMNPSKAFPPSPRKGAYDKVKAIKAVGKYECVFELSGMDAPFGSNLSIGILPREATTQLAEALTGKGYESGAFMLEKQTDQEWTLAKNPKYAAKIVGTSEPKLNKVIFKIITDNSTRYAALIKGDLDLVQNSLDADKVVEIQKNRGSKFNVTTRISSSTNSLVFNFKTPLFQKVEVRNAIAKAINVDEILKYLLQGLGTRAASMFPEKFEYYEPSLKPISYDPKQAMALLDRAGLPDPDGPGPLPRASFVIKVPTNKERIAVAKAVAAQLKQVGLSVQVESLEFGLFAKQNAEGLIAAWIGPWSGFKDPDHLHFIFHSKQTPPIGGNRGYYANTKVDQLLDAGQAEMDPMKRKPLYAEAQKILASDYPYVYLWHKLTNVVAAKNVKGYEPYSDSRYISLTEVSKD